METLESFKQGVEMTASGLKSVLQSFGIEEVSSLHQPFNPSFHEAIGQEESSEVPTDHVTQVFRKPYKISHQSYSTGSGCGCQRKFFIGNFNFPRSFTPRL